MFKRIELLLDTAKAFIESLISKKDRSYFELNDGSGMVSVSNPIRDFFSKKVKIKVDLQISRGALILIITGIVIIMFFLIKGIIKGARVENKQ